MPLRVGRVEPELALFLVAAAAAIVARFLRGRPSRAWRSAEEGRVRVCVAADARSDVLELFGRFAGSASRRYEVCLGVLIECDRMEDALRGPASLPPEYRHRVHLHHTARLPREAHARRLRKMQRMFVNGMEDLVVLADERVVPELGWDAHLMAAFADSPAAGPPVVVTCPLCVHPAGFPTLRTRGNGDVVRDEAKPFAHPAAPGVFVPAVCPCHEFLAFLPARPPPLAAEGGEAAWAPVALVVPAFALVRAVAAGVEEDVLDCNLAPLRARLADGERLGITPGAPGAELYHKYGSAAAARLAVKLDRRRAEAP